MKKTINSSQTTPTSSKQEAGSGLASWEPTIEDRKRASLKGELSTALAMLATIYGITQKLDELHSEELEPLEEVFAKDILVPLRKSSDTDGRRITRLYHIADNDIAPTVAFHGACAYLAQTINYLNQKDFDKAAAWSFVCETLYWTGIAVATLRASPQIDQSTLGSAWARAAAHERHRENRAMKAQVFAWCDAESLRFKSMDAMAQAVAGQLVPVTFRTARAWIGEWKKRRSAA